jgi:5-methylcytosine-specific restriction protein B
MFGIKYADEIAESGSTPREVVSASGMKPSYLTELHKGIRLARHVVLRDDI